MQVLPPGLDRKHKRPFGRLTIELGKVSLSGDYHQQPKLVRIKFLGEEEHLLCREQSTVEYRIHCSLWHFYQYLKEAENLRVEILADKNSGIVGSANVFLPLLLPRSLDSNLNNLIDVPTDQSYNVFRTQESPPFDSKEIGKIAIRIHTIFDQTLCEAARPYVSSLVDATGKTKKPISKETRLNKPSSDQVLDMMLLQREFNPLPPSPIKAQPTEPAAHNPKTQEISIQEHAKLMEEDIDRMVAELQSRQYDSSKYQDALQQTGYKTAFKQNPSSTSRSPMLPCIEMSEYQLNPASNMTGTVTYNRLSENASQSTTPLMYSKQPPIALNQFQKKAPAASSGFISKSLKIDIYELSFSGMPFSEQQLIALCASKLRMLLPNQQTATFSGKRSGETVAYEFKGYEVEVNQRTDSSGHTKLFGDNDLITFTIVEDFTGKELAYGTLNLDRLIRAEGRGVFVVALNNRNLKAEGSAKLQTLSASELSRLKPTSHSLYGLRVGLQLLSHAKGKVYQLLLTIGSVADLEAEGSIYQLRYKLYGTQQTIQLECKVGGSLNHSSVMPVLLESIVAERQPKIIIEIWSGKFQSLIGLVDLQLQQIPKILLHSNGKLDESVLAANLYPIFLYKGSQSIRQLITKKTIGSMDIGLAFGSVKQINKVMADRQQGQPALVPNVMRQEKKVVLPYDDKMGLFVKEKKKEVREIDVQVDIPEEPSQFGDALQHSPIKCQPDQSIVSEEESLHMLYIRPSAFHQQPTRDLAPSSEPDARSVPVQPEPTRVMKTLTRQFLSQIQQLIEKVLSINPNFLSDLKQAVGKYLLFSFIERPVLQECMLSSTKLNEQTVGRLIELIPATIDSTMLSITPLYDYFTSFSVSRTISEKLISQELLGQFMLQQYATQVDYDHSTHFLADKDEVKDVLMDMGYQMTLREVEVFWKKYCSMGMTDKGTWQKLVAHSKQLAARKQQKLTVTKVEQIDLLNAIYEPCNQSQLSQPKHNCLNITLRGLESCVESARCLLGIPATRSTVKITLFGQSITFQDDTSKEMLLASNFHREGFAEERGTAQLYSDDRLISQCVINLQRLVLEDIDGTYAMKTQQGSFCGLLRLALQFFE